MRTLCHDLAASTPGEEVTLEGWVHRRRELSRVTFLVVRDRSGLAQVVLPPGTAVPPEETTVRVRGTATANPQAPGGVEVTDARVEPLTSDAATPPAELWRPGDYERAIAARGEDPRAYESYLQAFRHGMPPHGGFAIGLERWVARLVGAANVREVTLYPRDLHRLTP